MLKKINIIVAILGLLLLSGCDKKDQTNPTQMNPNFHNLPPEVQSNAIAEVDNDGGLDPNPDSPVSSDVELDPTETYTGEKNPVLEMELNSPDDIDREKALLLFNGMGLIGKDAYHQNLGFQKSLDALCLSLTGKANSSMEQDYTGPGSWGCKGVTLDSVVSSEARKNQTLSVSEASKKTMKELLFEEYKLLKEALVKYKDYPDISFTKTPKLFESSIEIAAQELTLVNPPEKRIKLMTSLMQTESGKTHWKNFRPVASQNAAFGIGQFLPFSAKLVGINPYDPQENIKGIARLINRNLGKSGATLHSAVAAYNGSGPGAQEYATGILNRI